MKLTLEPTSRIVDLETATGLVPGRVWQGHTETGVEVVAVIVRVATGVDNDQRPFQETLIPVDPGPAALDAFPNRLVV